MIETLIVKMFGKPIGVLHLNQNGFCEFEYNESFTKTGIEPSPLLMPVTQGRVFSFMDLDRDTYHGLPGMIADSLPDSFGQALLNQYLEINDRKHGEANVIEKLSFQGRRCMGALEFEPARETYLDESSLVQLEELQEVAREALSSKDAFRSCIENHHQAILDIIKIGTSAGGQRAKAVIALNDKTGEIRSGQVETPEGFNYWLLKFDGFDSNGKPVDPANFGRREYAFSKCVKDAGIEMTECRLLNEGDRAHFLTRRFDRTPDKIHMQTLCGLAHYDFHKPGAYSYEQAFGVMRRLKLDYTANEEFFRRLVFNVLSVNMDDHTKNISFLMDKNGKWSLSPAYDIGFSYNPKGQWANAHQMTIAGKMDNITFNDLVDLGVRQGIKHPEQLIEQVADGLAKFPQYAKEAGVPNEEIDALIYYMKEKSANIFTATSITLSNKAIKDGTLSSAEKVNNIKKTGARAAYDKFVEAEQKALGNSKGKIPD